MKIGVVAVLTASLLLTACGTSDESAGVAADLEAQNEELREQVAALQTQLEESQSAAEEVKSDADQLRTASDDLRGDVDRLQSENWRDVVPDIESGVSSVEDAQLGMDSSLSDLDEAVEQ